MDEQDEPIDLSNNQIVRPVIGTFFQNLAGRMFRARVLRHPRCREGEVYADLESDYYDARMEVKATLVERYFKVSSAQFENYRRSMENPFPYSFLWYIFFSHGVRNISKTYTDPEDLYRDLILNTIRVVVLDFSVVERIAAGLEVMSIYEHSGYIPFLKWLKGINPEIEADPRSKVIRLGLNPDNYEIGKKRIKIEYNGTVSKTILTVVVKKR